MKHRVAVLGATGYAGRELIERVLRHPRLQLVAAGARQDADRTLGDVFAAAPRQPLCALAEIPLSEVDTLFLCLPHGASAEWARRGLESGCRVIDLSADFRLRDPELYARTYGAPHPQPQLLSQAVYGLTERARAQLPGARLIANPGCYPTSVLLALLPLLGRLTGLVLSDSKSGVSGAGRSPSVPNLYGEVAENVRPYQVGNLHRHRPEMMQELGLDLIFTPQVVPCFRGMLSHVYVDWHEDPRAMYEEFYAGEPFVEVLPAGEVATMAHTRESNRCVLSLHPLPEQGKLLVISSIDNLVKGAAGQALQNLNAAEGWPETEGLCWF